MKLFPRKGLIAVVTATALTAGSLTTPALAQTENESVATSAAETTTETPVTEPSQDNNASGSSTDSEGTDVASVLKEITKWVGIVSSIVTIVGTVVTLVGKIQGLFK